MNNQINYLYLITFIITFILMMLGMESTFNFTESSQVKSENIIISLKTQVQISGDLILLGEIAYFEGAKESVIESLKPISLGKSPQPGSVKTITFRNILYQLKKNHFDPNNFSCQGADFCLIERECHEITVEEIKGIFIELFYKKFSKDEVELERIEVHLTQPLKITGPDREFEIHCPKSPTRAEENFLLQTRQDGQSAKSIRISAGLRYHTTSLITTRKLNKGEQIMFTDIQPQHVVSDHLDPDHINAPSQALGLICRQSLSGGTVLSSKMLEKPLLIKKGAIIKIIVENQNLSVITLGQAMTNGYQGETITVQNLSSQKNVYGVVSGENQVRINF